MFKELLYVLKRPYHFVKTGLLNGVPAQIKYRFPARQLNITTITGTDGKTTSSTLLYHVLKTAGYKVGLISTVAAYIGQDEIDTGFHVTTPQPSDIQRFMRRMVDNGFTHLILEVTSHGSYQYRNWGVSAIQAGLTNVAHEHLDYHLNYEEYLRAKAAILAKAPIIALNEDDGSYLKLRRLLTFGHTLLPYSQQMSLPRTVKAAILERFPETYNQMNARLVYTLAQQIGVPDAEFCRALTSFAGVPGRMETVPTKRPFDVIIDFAHTPQGLESVLTALRTQLKQRKTGGRLIAVGGCAGLRDQRKRPEMGRIAVTLADIAVFTAEDPRTEDVWSIIRQMKEQLSAGHDRIASIADRREAIDFAVNTLAQKGDIVVLFGKGPEKSMCYGTTEYPWSDKDTVLELLKKR